MSEYELSIELGPCGWPKKFFGNSHEAFVDGAAISELLPDAERIGEVIFSDLSDIRPTPAYRATIGGTSVRFAFDEVTQGHYLVASNDAEISVEDSK